MIIDVDDNNDEETNCCFKDLYPWELEIVKAGGCHHNIHSKI
jgi:hypothetical protein